MNTKKKRKTYLVADIESRGLTPPQPLLMLDNPCRDLLFHKLYQFSGFRIRERQQNLVDIQGQN